MIWPNSKSANVKHEAVSQMEIISCWMLYGKTKQYNSFIICFAGFRGNIMVKSMHNILFVRKSIGDGTAWA